MTRNEYRRQLRKVRRQLRTKGLPECLASYWRPGEWVVRECGPSDAPDRIFRGGFVASCERVVRHTYQHHLSRWHWADVDGLPEVAMRVLWDAGKWQAYNNSIGARLSRGETVAV